MSTCTLQIRLDSSLRKEADDLFASAGLDLSSAVRLFLRQSVIRRRLPFDVVSTAPAPSQGKADRPFLPVSPAAVAQGQDKSVERKKKTDANQDLPPWFGLAAKHIHVTPGMKHDMASIREDIGRGIAAELAKRESGYMMVAED